MALIQTKEYSTMDEFREKVAEIKGLPECAINTAKAKDILLGYKSDRMYSNMIARIFKR